MKRDPDPTDPLAAAVVAWHNRWPLARRVRARHVQAVGVVALPFRRGDVPAVTPTPTAEAAPAPSPPHPEPVELTTPLDGSEVDLVFDDSPPEAAVRPDVEPDRSADIVAATDSSITASTTEGGATGTGE